MTSWTMGSKEPFWMVYSDYVAEDDSSDPSVITDMDDWSFEIWTTQEGAENRAKELADESNKTYVFKVEPQGFFRAMRRVEYTALNKTQHKTPDGPRRRQMDLNNA